MKFVTKMPFLVCLAIVLLLPNADAWAVRAFMKVTGERQGEIQGSVASPPEYENWIEVGSFGHNLAMAADAGTGHATGHRHHGPIRVVIPFDTSAPSLYSALATNERLPTVEIRFLRRNVGTGAEEHFFTIKLYDALVSSISPSLVPSDGFGQMMSVVSFTYLRIKWTHEIDGREFEDNWDALQ